METLLLKQQEKLLISSAPKKKTETGRQRLKVEWCFQNNKWKHLLNSKPKSHVAFSGVESERNTLLNEESTSKKNEAKNQPMEQHRTMHCQLLALV
jgi:hypothetical protein